MTDVLSLDKVTAGYGGPPAIRNVSLHVAAGEVVALLGANGAGKSTTLLAAVGELPLHSGHVNFAGLRSKAKLHRRSKRGLAFVPEGRSVFKAMSTMQNLRVAGVDPERVTDLFPELKSRMNIRGGLLSGGEQQMLALGRALAREPRLLLADELSLGLAPLVVDRLLEAVCSAAHDHGAGVLLVEQHVRKVLRYADRVYLLRRGEIVMETTAADARERIVEIEHSYLSADVGSAA